MPNLLVLGRDDVRRLITMGECIELTSAALQASSARTAGQLLRQVLPLPGESGNSLSAMCGYLSDPPCFGAKIVSVFPRNHANGRQSHQGAVVLFEPEAGIPTALIHAGEVTALRTAAASAVATRLLARPEAEQLAVLGYGDQAESHVAAMVEVRPIHSLRIWGRSHSKAVAFAERMSLSFELEAQAASTVEQAVQEADIICTVTAAHEPILRGEWVAPGTHLNVVGSSTRDRREVDSSLVARARLFVDYRPMTETAGGEYLVALAEGHIDPHHILGEIGDLIVGSRHGRTHDQEITMFKSLGIPPEDVMVSAFLRQRALACGVGTSLVF